MKDVFARRTPLILWVIFVLLTFQLISSWVFVRYVHYSAQVRCLEPDAYEASLITAADYALLQDRTRETVTLSDGTSYSDRQPSFYQHVLPNYRRVGDHYLLVKTLGTSHYYHRWLSDTIPLLFFVLAGLVLATIHNSRRTNEKLNADE